MGKAIADIIYELNDVATAAIVENLASGLNYNFDAINHTVTISGTPQAECTFKLTVSGDKEAGVKDYTTTGIITLTTPYKDLTNGWYKFQDAFDAIPAELQGVIELVQGNNADATSDGQHKKGDTYIDPEKEESSSGYDNGAVCLGESNGGIKLNLEQGVLKLFLHAFFTGGRQFKISSTVKGGEAGKSVTTEKYKKGAYEFDVLELLGYNTDAERANVRSVTFQQEGANGGARIYEMYITVPDNSSTAVQEVQEFKCSTLNVKKVVVNGRIAIIKNGVRYDLMGREF